MSVSRLISDGQRILIVSVVDPTTGDEVMRGMGYQVDDATIVTSAHVVPDDRYTYHIISGGNIVGNTLTVQSRLSERDIAILSPIGKISTKKVEEIFVPSSIKSGDTVYIAVARSGAITQLSGKVDDATAQVIAYNQRGEVRVFSGIILPDTPFLPGDSGAPIFTAWGKLIDVVHVE